MHHILAMLLDVEADFVMGNGYVRVAPLGKKISELKPSETYWLTTSYHIPFQGVRVRYDGDIEDMTVFELELVLKGYEKTDEGFWKCPTLEG